MESYVASSVVASPEAMQRDEQTTLSKIRSQQSDGAAVTKGVQIDTNAQEAPAKTPRLLITVLAVVASLSGLLFGYDASSINDALPLIKDEFALSDSMKGNVVSILLLGAVIGSLVAGIPADRIGRRWTIIISGALFIVGCTLASWIARNVALLIIGRLVIGVALGITSAVSPLFIAELAPAKHRGGLVMLYQLSITAGILIALGIGHALTASRNWRLMIFLAVIPAGAQIIGMLFVPESPRFLLSIGKPEAALDVLHRIRGSHAQAVLELAEIKLVKEEEGRVSWRDVFGAHFRGPMLAGVGLAVLSALDGINAIMYYSTEMFKIAGQSNATMSSLAVGITNFGMSVIALYLVNSFPRRRLLFIGITGQIIGLVLASAPLLVPGNVSTTGGWVMVAGVLLFVTQFAYSSGPLAWVVISEVFPLGARGKGAGIATACNWLSNYVVALVYPIAIGSQKGRQQQRRVGWSFVAFGVVCFFSLAYVHFFVPETHRLSLEEIEEQFEARRRGRKHAQHAGGDAENGLDAGAPTEAQPQPSAAAPAKSGVL